MAEPVKPPRATDFPRRRERARATRRRVLDAARDLFVERGYVGTTIQAIAERAEVAPETVYSKFKNKRSILSDVLDVSIAGDIDAPPILEQEWVQRIGATPDARTRLRMLAGQGRMILERRAAIDEVVRGAAAADLDIALLRDRGAELRLAGQRELLRMALGSAPLRRGMDLATAADILYALGSPETFLLLVVDRGWDGSQFEAWYADTLELLLLAPEASGRD